MIMKEADSEIYLNILSIDLFNSLPENYKSRIYPVIVLYECPSPLSYMSAYGNLAALI
jgi:hypothetical protein